VLDWQRRDRLARIVQECAATPGRAVLAEALCGVCVDVLSGVDAAALTLRGDARAEEMVGASDEWAVRIEELQYTLGEGPRVEAFDRAEPVAVPDVEAGRARWPAFSSQAAAAGLAATHVFPLRAGGIRLGTLALYQRGPGGLSTATISDAALLADLSTHALLRQSEFSEDDDQVRMTLSYQDVNMATGMLAAQLKVSLDDAFARVRAHAFSSGRSVLDVAHDLLERRIPLDRFTD
jgi:GAF domain-containing protein